MQIGILGTVFFVSGACSLVYQVAWVRGLTLVVGSSAGAIALVASVFMSGLGLGALIAARALVGRAHILAIYIALETIISLCAFASPWVLDVSGILFATALAPFADSPLLLKIARAVACIVLLLIPTVCMGATLPVLSAHLERCKRSVVSRIGVLYGLNTLGACIGCFLAGFVLLPLLGLSNTLILAAAVNAALPLTVRFLVFEEPQQLSSDSGARRISGEQMRISLFSACIGFVGMAAELIWTRLLVLVAGGSIYTFSSILSVFLASYGLGALAAGIVLRFVPQRGMLLLKVTTLLLLVALALCAVTANALPDLYVERVTDIGLQSRFGLAYLQGLSSLVLIAPSSFLLGFIFPLLILVLQQPEGKAHSTGLLYAANTFGGVLGVCFAHFFGIPVLGLSMALRVLILVLVTAALFCVLRPMASASSSWRKLLYLSIGCVLAVLAWFIVPSFDPITLSAGSGVYSRFYKNEALNGRSIAEVVEDSQELLFYKDGITATITVARDRKTGTHDRYLLTNGKIDGSSHFDMPTQKLAAHLTALLSTQLKNVAVIGYGTGTTVGSFSLHRHNRTTVFEIEPAIISAAELFNDVNNNPLQKDSTTLHLGDPRLYLRLRPRMFDVVLSEPSNPWIAGVSDLFTVEFYRIAQKALRDGGVFGQWVQMYNIDTETLQMVIRTFSSVFPNTYVAVTLPGADLLLLGVSSENKPSFDSFASLLAYEPVRRDLEDPNVGIYEAEQLAARFIFGPRQTREFASAGPLNTDDLPLLSYVAPLSLPKKTKRENMRALLSFSVHPARVFDWKMTVEKRAEIQTHQDWLFESFQN